MEAFLLVSWVLLLAASYKGAVIALDKSNNL